MHRTLTISEELYARLEAEAHERGLESIEQLLEEWERKKIGLQQRLEHLQRIDQLRGRLQEKYGQMPDSTGLVREDRVR